ncbi:HlyD family type I secretion periplasmic adaptor subunit [Litorivivens sp.]|uniref:HlyD family type I secretion periplasmic adaptor subunit n=2 Tax=Litorivivens sp. TaxID=2020868 RepID=UPI003568E8E8
MALNSKRQSYDDSDLAYMRSLSAAVLERSPKQLLTVLYVMVALVVVALVWAAWAELDVVVRGGGKVIPARQVQQVQSLEGGVVAEILVREGDLVKMNQPLLKLSDVAFASSFQENRLKYFELVARSKRLQAEAFAGEFDDGDAVSPEVVALINSEKSLFQSNRQQLVETLSIYRQQIQQQQRSLEEAQSKLRQLQRTLKLVREEIAIKKPLMQEKIISEVEFLQLRQRESELEGEIEISSITVPRLRSSIEEARGKLGQSELDFRNEAKRELNEVLAEISRIEQAQNALEDRVMRTVLRSPVNGVVKRLHANSLGGVVQPGTHVLEIVPLGDSLLVEARIKPADIATIEVGQLARLKFSAYDFAIHGSLTGLVKFISADTITDDDGSSFYIVRIAPDRDYLGKTEGRLPIKVGMTTEIDVVTGKKTILSYLLKPINRGLQNALREQ